MRSQIVKEAGGNAEVDEELDLYLSLSSASASMISSSSTACSSTPLSLVILRHSCPPSSSSCSKYPVGEEWMRRKWGEGRRVEMGNVRWGEMGQTSVTRKRMSPLPLQTAEENSAAVRTVTLMSEDAKISCDGAVRRWDGIVRR